MAVGCRLEAQLATKPTAETAPPPPPAQLSSAPPAPPQPSTEAVLPGLSEDRGEQGTGAAFASAPSAPAPTAATAPAPQKSSRKRPLASSDDIESYLDAEESNLEGYLSDEEMPEGGDKSQVSQVLAPTPSTPCCSFTHADLAMRCNRLQKKRKTR